MGCRCRRTNSRAPARVEIEERCGCVAGDSGLSTRVRRVAPRRSCPDRAQVDRGRLAAVCRVDRRNVAATGAKTGVKPVTTPSHRATARRALVLLNTNARRGQGRDRYAVVQPAIDELFDTRIAETEPAGNDGAVRAALDDGIRTFIAAGGDGTVNVLVDALGDADVAWQCALRVDPHGPASHGVLATP